MPLRNTVSITDGKFCLVAIVGDRRRRVKYVVAMITLSPLAATQQHGPSNDYSAFIDYRVAAISIRQAHDERQGDI